MDPDLFDQISKFFAQRRFSRRQAVTGGTGGLAAALAGAYRAGPTVAAPAPAAVPLGGISGPGAADAVPAVAPAAAEFMVSALAPGATAVATPTGAEARPIAFLFVQSFEAGSLVPKPGVPGRYTLTLRQGLGDTIYFSDRPAKIVGTVPTDRFLKGLGFTPANPPNAALVCQRDATHKDVVVLELFNPHHDASTNTLTHEVTLLQDWHKLDETFELTPDDEQHLPRDFTAAHLFIDDCPDAKVTCWKNAGYFEGDDYIGELGRRGTCYQWQGLQCLPCDGDAAARAECNAKFPACNGQCIIHLEF